jgi:RND family efflux transporter MFP subunit
MIAMRIFSFIIGLSICLMVLEACSPSAETAVQEKVSPISVRIMHVKHQELPLVVESVGRLAANREVTLAAEVSGVVESYHADIGDRVKEGQILLRIDSTDYRLALMDAEASLSITESRLDLAKKVYERAKTLLPRKVITPDDFDKSEADYLATLASMKRATVMVDIARERLDKTRIRSPFDGLIAGRMIEVGQTLGAGQPVLTLVDLSSMRVQIHLPEKEYVQLGKEDPVTVIVEAYPEAGMKGRIDRIGIKADERTNTFEVEVLVDNPHFLLKAGLTARVRITADIIHEAMLIPQSTVQYKKDREEVFIVGPEQRAEVRRVALGRTTGDMIQIISGLVPGDQLIVSGGQYLKPGDRVLITAFGQAGMK